MLWPKKKDAEHERMGDGRGGRGAWAHGLLPPPTRGQRASQVALVIKNLPANAGDVRGAGSIPGSGKSPGEGNGSPLQYSCLEDPMDRGAWQATVHRVTKSWTRLKRFSMHILYFLKNDFLIVTKDT